MKHITVLASIFVTISIIVSNTSAQTPPPPFHVGVHGFAPEWDPDTLVLHYIEGYVPNPTGEYQRQHLVGQEQFDRARALGVNMR